MSSEPTFIRTIVVEGFRAYLQPKTFDFSKQRSLAVFAPNGLGKSSLIDALEFAFSDDGSLERLGARVGNNLAGPTALEHNLAAGAKITPRVAITFRAGTVDSTGERLTSGKRPQPTVFTAVKAAFRIDPVIRGYQLRSFVEHETPQERYHSVARWLQIAPLTAVQKDLRALRIQVKAKLDEQVQFVAIGNGLSKVTDKAITAWSTATVVDHANTVIIQPLDAKLTCASLNASDPAIAAVAQRAADEETKLGVEGLRTVRNALAALHEAVVDEASGEVTTTGLLRDFAAAIEAKKTAAAHLAEEQAAASTAIFAAVWKEAEPIFAGAESPDDCPICSTPVADSKAGGREAIHAHLTGHLVALKDFNDAKTTDGNAGKALSQLHTQLATHLKSLVIPPEYSDAAGAAATLKMVVESWKLGDALDAEAAIEAFGKAVADLDARIVVILEKQGEHTYVAARTKLKRLIELREEFDQETRIKAALSPLVDELNTKSAFISSEIRKHVLSLLDSLQEPVNAIYAAIQADKAVPIRLELPPEDDVNQERLNVMVDFAINRQGVQPSGYLSDSQIHSLALALRLAAIRAFNTATPFVALDDIVTSYDADHRRTIAALLAKEFADFQIILTTHDERFFFYLKDQQAQGQWRLARILKLDPAAGPTFADEQVSDAMVEERWAAGESAANEMRKAEEEWLLTKCREFGAYVRIRQLERAYSYDRGELADALTVRLKESKLVPPMVSGVKNAFLASLQSGVVENFGSHFQDAPYGDGSIGDEKARWTEFKAFRGAFACPKCKRVRFKRPNGLSKAVCAHAGCETPFEFSHLSTVAT